MSPLNLGKEIPALFVVNIPALIYFVAYAFDPSWTKRRTLRMVDHVSGASLGQRYEEGRGRDVQKPLNKYEPKERRISVISSSSEWDAFWAETKEEVERTKVVGFDCEWVSKASSQSRRRESTTTTAEMTTTTTTETMTTTKTTTEKSSDITTVKMTELDANDEVSPGEEDETNEHQIGHNVDRVSVGHNEKARSFEEGDVKKAFFDGRVSMIQIATSNGYCGLVRILDLIESSDAVPESLTTLLANKTILKLGVSPKDDANRLFKDHCIEVVGCLDLRAFVLRCRDFEHLEKLGLKNLAESILGQTLDKSPRLRLSDWEAEELTRMQKEYAADDALVAVDIFRELVIRKSRNRGPTSWFFRSSSPSSCDDADFWIRAFSMCQGLVDATFKAPSPNPRVRRNSSSSSPSLKSNLESASSLSSSSSKWNPRKTKAYVQRSKPLYENCHLMAPDGELLSTCNSNKALWYVEKQLGDIVSAEGEQLKVRLRFEPAGRPVEDGIYYIQEKENKCVVCGSQTDFNLRKNIIPQEYRKHFPTYMKDHSSHDVLLMCLPCHQLANLKDHVMRIRLSEMCEAPIGTVANIRCFEDADLKKVKSFGKALLQSKDRIPEDRRKEMRLYLAQYYEVGEDRVDEDIYQRAAKMDTKTPNHDFKPHGLKVIEWMNSKYGDDLASFEKMWRQHFVDAMQPQFLPFMWSVDHNHKNVRSRVAQGDAKFLKHRLGAENSEA